MSARAALGRLAGMDGRELRFRFVCEARKAAGRLRYASRPLAWDRADLSRILDPHASPFVARAVAAARRQQYVAAHRDLSEHFRTRTSSWPVQARKRGELAGAIRGEFPDAIRATRSRADRIVGGRHDLLGYRDLDLGNPPDWHLDAVHNRRAPAGHWASVPYLDPASGDHKVIWETNRHQYFLSLGSAYWLTGDRRYRETFVAHLESWLAGNPPLHGVNWSSMLELAFRTMSWTWAVEFFAADGEQDEVPWLVDLLIALDRQLTHVAQNLSTYFSPNTHLSGEALALYAVSTAFPELGRSAQRIRTGRTILLDEARNQVRADGGHAELSAHYHRYSTDFYLLASMVARASNDAAAPAFAEAARRQAEYLRTIADDTGRLPLIGDDDGGRLFAFGDDAASDASATLGAAAALLANDALAVGPPSDDTAWILGRPAAAPHSTAPWPSRLLPDSGYFVSRMAGGSHLVFDAGPHGFLNGGHAHADALSVVLTVAGEPLLIDPGTGSYTMEPATRDRFRASRMHNTLILDGTDHAQPDGPFHWRSRADARFLVARTASDLCGGGSGSARERSDRAAGADASAKARASDGVGESEGRSPSDKVDFAVGTHDGYAGVLHLRAVVVLHGIGWLIVDRVITARPVNAELFWHLHPDWRASVRDATVDLLHGSGRHLAFVTTAHDLSITRDPDLSSYAPEYGRIQRATTLVAASAATQPFSVGTFIPATAARKVAIVELPPETGDGGWVETRFALLTDGRETQVGVSFPTAGLEAQRPDWPQPCITRLEVVRVN